MTLIRNMTLDDIEDVSQIERDSFANPVSKESFKKEITENDLARYFVIEDGDIIVGYFAYWLVDGQAHILNIAVARAYRNKGYGNLLIKAMIEEAKKEGSTKLSLEVRKSNLIARHLYDKYGFVQYGIRKDYYRDPREDAYIMWLDIEEEL